MAQPWFTPKTRGYGAVPITWQGWLLTLACALAIAASIIAAWLARQKSWQIAGALAALAVFVVLVITARATSDGEWRWR